MPLCANYISIRSLCRVTLKFEHIISGELVRLERSRPFLQPDAIPTIFPNVPKYLSKPVPKKRNPTERLDPQFAPPQKKLRIDVASPDTSDEAHMLAANSVDYQNVIVPSNQWGEHVFF
ncbi:hypothetical protein HPB49_023793 [Dermacentor silvarum]|uniref:Uncharacterized protein n=1 Tax=Dermacentor silvarum TaxID=543639 RepID=A0ACB8D8P3_DERSI|nr:hypothetical protein HPB49_023793 [Dermacentor silvarum]